METWNILDENGNPTGKTMNKGDKIVWQEGIYHPGTDVWIINSENKLLIQKRSPEKKFAPNVWAMTGGSIMKGESALETLKRETMEELGVELDVKNAIKIKRYRTDNVWLDEYIVRQDIDLDKVILQEEEVCDVKYATYDEIEELFQNNLFIGNRWEYVRDEIREYLLRSQEQEER